MASPGRPGRLPILRDGRALLLSAVLLALSFPPFDLVVPAFLALAPLAVWIDGAPSGRAALRGGLVFGFVLWLLLLRWLPVTLARFYPEALPGWLLVVALLALVGAGTVWAAHRLRHGTGLPLWLAVPLAWTAGEWLRARLPGSLAFPWLDLGTSLAGHPEWIGIAEVVGGRGVGFLLALAGGLLGSAWVAWRGRRGGGSGRGGEEGEVVGAGPTSAGSRPPGRRVAAAARVAAAVAVLVVPAAWGVHRAGTLVSRPSLRVAVIQTAIPQESKRDPWAAAEEGVAAVERLLPRVAGAAGGAVDLAVLPEALLPIRLEGRRAGSLRDRLEGAAARAGVPVLVGALGLDPGGPGPDDDVAYNSVFLVRPDRGLAGVRYDKRHLVPVVERVPLPSWAGGGDGGAWGSYGFGGPAAPFPFETGGAGKAAVGVLICLESSFARAARDLRREGADVLVNVTNDAWLNARSPWARTSALRQHPAHLVMRAIETRAGAARSSNTGISLFVEPTGRIREGPPVFEEGVSVHTLRTTDGVTPFVRWGDVAGSGAFALAALLVLLPLATRTRAPGRPDGRARSRRARPRGRPTSGRNGVSSPSPPPSPGG